MALSDNLYAYYKLDETASGASAIDVVGGKTLVNQGPAIGSAPGIINTARDFPGAGPTGGNTLIRNANTTDFFCGANPFSMSCWVKFSTLPPVSDIGLANRFEPAGQREYILFLQAGTNKIGLDMSTASTTFGMTWPTPVTTGTWYFLVAGWDGTNMKISVNGATFVNSPFFGPMVNGGDNFKLGLEAGPLVGQMDEFGFWIGRCLSQAEVTQLYNGGAGLPFSSFGGGPPPPSIWPSDGSFAGIQAIHDATTTLDGDTITVPVGTFPWTLATGPALTITKAITLQGAGVGSTIIKDNVQAQQLINISLKAGKLTRITNIEFQDGGRVNTMFAPVGIIQVGGSNTNGSQFRLDHFKWVNLKGFVVTHTVIGVIDHGDVHIYSPGTGQLIFIYPYCREWNGGTRGHGSWADPIDWGSGQALYIEDCTMVNDHASPQTNAQFTDGFGGARFVFRHNNCTGGTIGNHGTESPGQDRGCRKMEIYQNTLNGALVGGNNNKPASARAGSIMFWGNTCSNFTANPIVSFAAFRMISAFAPWGGADGRNPWDLNVANGGTNSNPNPFFSGTVATFTLPRTLTVAGNPWSAGQWVGFTVRKTSDGGYGYINASTSNSLTWSQNTFGGGDTTFAVGDAFTITQVDQCLDTSGTGPTALLTGDQTATPPVGWTVPVNSVCYIWNNTHNGVAGLNSFAPEEASMKQGVNYINNTPAPGYVPYTYPHPLVSAINKIIVITGPGGAPTLAFGNVNIGATPPTLTMTVANQGNTLLTVTGVSYPTGFTGNTGGFTVAPGSSFDTVVTFTPLLAQLYSGNIVVSSDATSGTSTILATGTGVNPSPPPGIHGHRKQARDAFGL